MDLMRQSGESLAGRISYTELGPFDALEIEHGAGQASLDRLWVRGGFPRSFLAASDAISMEWHRNFIRTYLERDVPQFGLRIPAETLRRLWTMLAHNQAQALNAANLAGLGVDGKTVAGYLDLLVDLLLVRRLRPWHNNPGKEACEVAQGLYCVTALPQTIPCSESGTKKCCWGTPWLDRPGKASLLRR